MKLLSDIKKIGIFRALQLGDLLCAIPAIRALRAAYPAAEITLIGLPWASALVQRFPKYLNRFIWFPGYPGLPEQEINAEKTLHFIHQMREEKFDLLFQMQGNGTIVNSLLSLLGAHHLAGFCFTGDYCPDENLFLPYPASIHEVERHIALMEFLGITSQGIEMEFPITANDEMELTACDFDLQKNKYVCIHAGSRGVWRQWPVEYFAALADYCHDQELQVVLTGTKDELSIVERLASLMKHEPVIAAGKTSLGAVAVLIRDAFALISNCTGVSHIAAALKTKSVVISMDGEPGRWAPLNQSLHKTIDWTLHPQFEKVLMEVQSLFQQPARQNSKELAA